MWQGLEYGVHLSVPAIDRCSSGFAAVGPAGRRYRLTAAWWAPSSNGAVAALCTAVSSSECDQCHVSSRRRRLNTGFGCYQHREK